MKKEPIYVIVAALVFLFSASAVLAQEGVGIGINNYHVTLSGGIGKGYTAQIGVLNPSNWDIDVKVSFDCKTCVSNVSLFGYKIGEKIDDYRSYFKIDKEMVSVPANTPAASAIPVSIHFSPNLLVKKYFKLYTPEFLNFFIRVVNPEYGNSFTLPYYTIFIGEKKMDGLVMFDVVASTFGYMGVAPSVAATLEMHAIGMPLGSFIFLLIIIAVVAYFVFKKVIKGRIKFPSLKKPFLRK